jgi:hypothetical protein
MWLAVWCASKVIAWRLLQSLEELRCTLQ